MEIYTIGFTKRTAESFFESLKRAEIDRLIDVRLHNSSQLAGFAKQTDLEYFLRKICGADYVHEPLLAPSQELFDAFKKEKGTWQVFERGFFDLMAARRVEDQVSRDLFAGRPVLLCSEATADNCHRRLVVEYLDAKWGDVQAIHL